MAVELSRDRPWADAICMICIKYFTDPVSLECGHNFCHSCITRCWEELHVAFPCPRWCIYLLEGRKSEPNRELANFVEATKQTIEQMKEEAKGWADCAEHNLPLNLFCEDDQAAICSWCKKLEAHRNHSVVGVDFSCQIDAYLSIPDEMRNEFKIYSCNFMNVTEDWLKRLEAARKRTVTEFQHLREFLNEQERLRLAKLVELEKEITRKTEENEKKVSNQITFLDEVYDLIGDMYNDERKFLQDFGAPFYSYDEKQLENPVLLPADVKDKIQKFCDRKLFLEEILKEFNDEIAALLRGRRRKRTRTEGTIEERGTRVNVTLDQDTAHHHLVVSANRKTVYYDRERHFLPEQPKRFYCTHCVLGHQAFTSGRYWWEVKVEGNGRNWAVGVARDSLERFDPVEIWNAKGVWIVGKQAEPVSPRRLLAFSYPETTLLILARKPEKLRVCLDYPGGQVAFFNAETDESVFVFRSCSFLGEKVRPFFWLFGGSVILGC